MSSESTSPALHNGVASRTLVIDSRQFSREAVLRASYWFTDDLFIELPASESGDVFEVILRAKRSHATLDDPRPTPLDELAGEFRNALIEAELRLQVQRETSSIRELILAKAFAESGVLESNPPGSFNDPVLQAIERESASTTLTAREPANELEAHEQ